MRLRLFVLSMVCALGPVGLNSASAQRVASIQSPARPFGLPVYGPVMECASDARSQDFYVNYMPDFLKIIDENLSDNVELKGVSGFKLDASRLFLRTPSDRNIRIYFLFEGADFHNTVGFSWTPAGATTPGAPTLLFPDATIKVGNNRANWEPLKCGDFVEIGLGDRGYQLDLFLISDGVNGGKHWFWNDSHKNADSLQHVVAFMLPGTPFILIGFEDILRGGDLDYNDALFVIDIGQINANDLDEDDESTLPH